MTAKRGHSPTLISNALLRQWPLPEVHPKLGKEGRGDVLVVGSSSGGVLARVFLGSNATRVVRHSPVPVIVVPA